MRHPPRDRLEAYAHGDIDVPRRLLIEAHLPVCPACRAEVTREQTPPAGESSPEASDVPAFERVWAAIERADAERSAMPPALPPNLLPSLPRPAEWRWVVLTRRGVRTTLLVRDPDTGSALYLSHYPRGSRFPEHRHLGLEETVVLAGGYMADGAHVDAGDWVLAAVGTEHEPTTAPDEECWCVSRVEAPGIEFSARGDSPTA